MIGGPLPSEAFGQRFRARVNERQRARVPFGPWSQRIPEPQTGPLDLRKFPYQREPYMETGDLANVVVKKGTQVGFSTLCLRWAMWVADELGGTCMYVFPTRDHVYKFSDQRVKPIITESEYLQQRIAPDDPQNKGLKKIGRGYVHFVGSRSRNDLDAVPANALVLDEYDELSQVNVPVVERRVGAAEHPMMRRIGVPTLTGYGISAQYEKTDKRRWMVKCQACNEWQRITWDNMRWTELEPRVFEAWRVCVKCERELDTALGEWVAEHPERSGRGYHVPRTIVPGLSRMKLGEMVAARTSDLTEDQEAHYQRDVAEGYETPESRLSVGAINSSKRHGIRKVESYVDFNPVTMGIDVHTARGLYVRISEHLNEREKRMLWAGTVDDDSVAATDGGQTALRKLAGLMDRYQVKMACIDNGPDGRFSRAFCAAHPGRAYAVAFNTSRDAKNSIVVPRWDRPADILVTVKRSEFISTTLDLFRAQRNLIPLEEPVAEDYEEQLRNLVRQRTRDKEGREFYIYEATGPIDWPMAELYDVVATEVLRWRLLEGAINLATTQEVELTPPSDPTPDLGDWEGRPWDGEDTTYGSGWDDEYRA
jgi:hypothetical protein